MEWRGQDGDRVVSHLGEDISCIGGGCGQGGEEGGLACRLDGVDHPQLRVFQVGSLAVGVDEHKDVVHTYRRESRASAGRLRITLLSPRSDPGWAWTNPERLPEKSGRGSPASQCGRTHLTLAPPTRNPSSTPCSLAPSHPQN